MIYEIIDLFLFQFSFSKLNQVHFYGFSDNLFSLDFTIYNNSSVR